MKDTIFQDMKELAKRSVGERKSEMMQDAVRYPKKEIKTDTRSTRLRNAPDIVNSVRNNSVDVKRNIDIKKASSLQQASTQQIVDSNQQNTQNIVKQSQQNTHILENKIGGLNKTVVSQFEHTKNQNKLQLNTANKQLSTLQAIHNEIYRSTHKINPKTQTSVDNSLTLAEMQERLKQQRDADRNGRPFGDWGILGSLASLATGALGAKALRRRGPISGQKGSIFDRFKKTPAPARPALPAPKPVKTGGFRSALKGRAGIIAGIATALGIGYLLSDDDDNVVQGQKRQSDTDIEKTNLMQAYSSGDINSDEYNERLNALNELSEESKGSLLPTLATAGAGAYLAKKGVDQYSNSDAIMSAKEKVDTIKTKVSENINTTKNAAKQSRIAKIASSASSNIRDIGTKAIGAAKNMGWRGKLIAGVAGGASLIAGLNSYRDSFKTSKDINNAGLGTTQYGDEIREIQRRKKENERPMTDKELVALRSSITLQNGYMPDPRTGFPLKDFSFDSEIATIMSNPMAQAAIKNGAPINEVLGGQAATYMARQGISPASDTTTAKNINSKIAKPNLPMSEEEMFKSEDSGTTLVAGTMTAAMIGKMAKDKLSEQPGTFTEKMSATSKNIVNSVKTNERISSLLSQATEKANSLTKSVTPMMQKAADVSKSIMSNTKNVIDGAKQTITPIADKIKPTVSGVSKTAVGGIKSLGSRALPGVNLAMAGYDTYNILSDDTLDSATKAKEVAKMGGGTAGALSGASAGALGGAALGSVVPIVGTAIGGAIGGIAGGIGGYFAGSEITDIVTDGISNTVETMGIGDMIGRAVAIPMSLFSEEARDSLSADFKNNIVPKITQSTSANIAKGFIEGVSGIAGKIGNFFGWTDEVQKEIPKANRLSTNVAVATDPTIETSGNIQKTSTLSKDIVSVAPTNNMVKGDTTVSPLPKQEVSQVRASTNRRAQRNINKKKDVQNTLAFFNANIALKNAKTEEEKKAAQEKIMNLSDEKYKQRAIEIMNVENAIILPTEVSNSLLMKNSPQSLVENLSPNKSVSISPKQKTEEEPIFFDDQKPVQKRRQSYVASAGKVSTYAGSDTSSTPASINATTTSSGQTAQRNYASSTPVQKQTVMDVPQERQRYESVSKVMMVEPKIQESKNTNTEKQKPAQRTGGVTYSKSDKSSLETTKSTPLDFGLPLLNSGFI